MTTDADLSGSSEKGKSSIETMNDETLMEVASGEYFTDVQKKAKLAQLELQRRSVQAQIRLTNETIDLAKANNRLSKIMIPLTVATLVLVALQTWVAFRQNALFEQEITAGPALEMVFTDVSSTDDELTATIGITNSGNRLAEGARIHFWTPSGVELQYSAKSHASTFVKTHPTHYQLSTSAQLYKDSITRMGKMTFRFTTEEPVYTIEYRIKAPKMKDVSGTFPILSQSKSAGERNIRDGSKEPKQS